MSGFNLAVGSSLLAPAAAALSGGSAARRADGRPSLSLALSGVLHAAALTAFLALWGRPAPEPPGIEIRAWTTPRIVHPMEVPPPIVRGGGVSADGRGIVAPSGDARDLDIDVILDGPIVDAPVRDRIGPPGEGGPAANGPGEVPGRAADPDLPSLYEEPPVPIHAPEPEYPTIARDAGIEGRVVVEALVGRDGRVRETRVREADPILAAAARNAIGGWKFKPATWNGRPVTAWVSIPVVFRLY